MKKTTPVNKVNRQSITVFYYYLSHMLPSLLKDFTPVPSRPHNYTLTHRKLTYHYLTDAVHTYQPIRPQTFLAAARELYLASAATRTGDFSALKQTTCSLKLVPVSGQVLDHIDITISADPPQQDQPRQRHGTVSHFSSRGSQRHLFSSLSPQRPPSTKREQPGAELFVIHRSQKIAPEQGLEWLNFIERYKFIKQHDEDGEPEEKIVHEAIMVHNQEGGLFSWDQSHRLLQKYFQGCCPLTSEGKSLLLNQMLEKVQLLEQLEVRQLKLADKQASQQACYHPSHRRSLRLSAEHKPLLNKLLPRTEAYFKSINPSREPKGVIFLEQLTCRMLQINSYKQKQSYEGIVYYLDMEKRLREKYSWEDFRELREMKFYDYIGKDKMGRPVLFNRVRNTLMSQIKDKKKMLDYMFYLYEIHMQDQMEGWVDTFNGLSDAAEQVSDNTDIIFSKNLLLEMAHTTLGRSDNVIVYNVGILSKLFAKIVFPLLPDSFIRTIHLYDSDEKTELMLKLRELMTNDVIPDFLGGNNDIDADRTSNSTQEAGFGSDKTDGNSFFSCKGTQS